MPATARSSGSSPATASPSGRSSSPPGAWATSSAAAAIFCPGLGAVHARLGRLRRSPPRRRCSWSRGSSKASPRRCSRRKSWRSSASSTPAPTALRALSAYGIVLGLAAVGGQLIGGVLVQADILGLGWRSCFLINLPIGAGALLAVSRLVPESRTKGRSADWTWSAPRSSRVGARRRSCSRSSRAASTAGRCGPGCAWPPRRSPSPLFAAHQRAPEPAAAHPAARPGAVPLARVQRRAWRRSSRSGPGRRRSSSCSRCTCSRAAG